MTDKEKRLDGLGKALVAAVAGAGAIDAGIRWVQGIYDPLAKAVAAGALVFGLAIAFALVCAWVWRKY